MGNILYYGDNQDILRCHKNESINIIYLDPPIMKQKKSMQDGEDDIVREEKLIPHIVGQEEK